VENKTTVNSFTVNSGYGSTTVTAPPEALYGSSGSGLPPSSGEPEIEMTLTDVETRDLEKKIPLSYVKELSLKTGIESEKIHSISQNKISIDTILSIYRRLQFVTPRDGDFFFEFFGPGKYSYIEKPFERFLFYEKLLVSLQAEDSKKYSEMHKGTPFFFLAWTAFEMRNFEKGLFYLDAAIFDDRRANTSGEWLKRPGGQLLALEISNHPATGIRDKIEKSLDEQLERFNKISALTPIDRKLFLEKFVKHFLVNPLESTAITTFYSFILEFEDRYKELKIRSTGGGSAEPFITHLFKGGLIFETILKHLYPKITVPTKRKKLGSDAETLGHLFNGTDFKNDFVPQVKTRATNLKIIYDEVKKDDMRTAFDTTSRLRNATGHNLIWQDVENVLGDPEKYRTLFEQEINSIFFIIEKKFIR